MEGKALFTILSNDSAYANAIGTDSNGEIKLYPNSSEQGVKRPYAVYNVVTSNEEYSKDGRGATVPRVQLDHYGNDADEVTDLETKAIAALDGYRGTVLGVNVNSIRVLNRNTGLEDQADSNRRSTDFSIRINL